MKAILEFELPEESGQHLRAVHSGLAFNTLGEVRNVLRQLGKGYITAEKACEAIQELTVEALAPVGE